MTYNLCNPFNPDIRCASLCGVDFEGKESAVNVRIERVAEIIKWLSDPKLKIFIQYWRN